MEDCSTEVARDVLVNEGVLDLLFVVIAGRSRTLRVVEDAPVSVVTEAEED